MTSQMTDPPQRWDPAAGAWTHLSNAQMALNSMPIGETISAADRAQASALVGILTVLVNTIQQDFQQNQWAAQEAAAEKESMVEFFIKIDDREPISFGYGQDAQTRVRDRAQDLAIDRGSPAGILVFSRYVMKYQPEVIPDSDWYDPPPTDPNDPAVFF